MDQCVISLLAKTDPAALTVINKAEKEAAVNEIRYRKNRHLTLTVGSKNVITEHFTGEQIIKSLFDELCKGSVYAHMDSIKNGYIMLQGGTRVGVCGHAVTENGQIKNVYDIESINIRISHAIYGICDRIYDKICEGGFYKSILIYSPPGAGKTTMIRDIAYKLASVGNRRIVIIDSRCEIADAKLKACENVDIMYAYPKAEAIEIATRTLDPQYIICDEIGSYDECESLMSVQSAGVPVIATAHASSVLELLRRKNIKLLHDNCFFDLYVGLKRNDSKLSMSFCRYDEVPSI